MSKRDKAAGAGDDKAATDDADTSLTKPRSRACIATEFWKQLSASEQHRAIVAVTCSVLLIGWLTGVIIMLSEAGYSVTGGVAGNSDATTEDRYKLLLEQQGLSASKTKITQAIIGNVIGPFFIIYGYQIPHLTIVVNSFLSAGLMQYIEGLENMEQLNLAAADGRMMPQQLTDLVKVLLFAFAIASAEMKILTFDCFMKGAVIGASLANPFVNALPVGLLGGRCVCTSHGLPVDCSPNVHAGLYQTEGRCYEDRWMRFMLVSCFIVTSASWGTIQKRRVLLLFPCMLGANLLCAGIFDTVLAVLPEYGNRVQPYWFVGMLIFSGFSLHLHYWMKNFDLEVEGEETDQLFRDELELFPLLHPLLVALHRVGHYTMYPLRRLDELCSRIEDLGMDTVGLELDEVRDPLSDNEDDEEGAAVLEGTSGTPGAPADQPAKIAAPPSPGKPDSPSRRGSEFRASGVLAQQAVATSSAVKVGSRAPDSCCSCCGRRNTEAAKAERRGLGPGDEMSIAKLDLAQHKLELMVRSTAVAQDAALDATRFLHALLSCFAIALIASAAAPLQDNLWGSVVQRTPFNMGVFVGSLLLIAGMPGTAGLQKRCGYFALRIIVAVMGVLTLISLATLVVSMQLVEDLNHFRPDSINVLNNQTSRALDAIDGGDDMSWARRPMESLHSSGVCAYHHAPIPFALNCTSNGDLRDFHRRRCVYMNTSDVVELERRSLKAFEDGDLSAHQLYVDQNAVATRVDLSIRTCLKKHGIDSRAAFNGTGLGALAPTATYCTCRLAIASEIYDYAQPLSMFAMGTFLFLLIQFVVYVYIFTKASLTRDLQEDAIAVANDIAELQGAGDLPAATAGAKRSGMTRQNSADGRRLVV